MTSKEGSSHANANGCPFLCPQFCPSGGSGLRCMLASDMLISSLTHSHSTSSRTQTCRTPTLNVRMCSGCRFAPGSAPPRRLHARPETSFQSGCRVKSACPENPQVCGNHAVGQGHTCPGAAAAACAAEGPRPASADCAGATATRSGGRPDAAEGPRPVSAACPAAAVCAAGTAQRTPLYAGLLSSHSAPRKNRANMVTVCRKSWPG